MPDDHSELVPLLPIPNRTVKRLCADDSADSRVKVGHRQALTALKTPLSQDWGVLSWGVSFNRASGINTPVDALRILSPYDWSKSAYCGSFTATNPMATQYTISQLAQEFDLTTRAIRFYEDMGLIHPERTGPGGRNRVYSARDRAHLKLTLRAKRLGLSLGDAKEILDAYDSPRDTVPQLEKFLAILATHRQQLEEQMADLHANLEELKLHEKEARQLLRKTTAQNDS